MSYQNMVGAPTVSFRFQLAFYIVVKSPDVRNRAGLGLLNAVELIPASLVVSAPFPPHAIRLPRSVARARRREQPQLRQVFPEQALEPHGAAADDAEVDLHDGPHAQHGLGVRGIGGVLEDDDVRKASDGTDDDAGRVGLAMYISSGG